MVRDNPWLLDLCSCAGGVGRGYELAGFHVVSVDIAPQRHNPHEFYQDDALRVLDVLLAGDEWNKYRLWDFDVIHASPPCQGYSRMRHLPWLKGKQYPLLIEPMRERLQRTGIPYVIENVEDAPLLNPITLCGLSFGLRLYRHRKFESNMFLFAPRHWKHEEVIWKGRWLNSRYSANSGGIAGILPAPCGHTAGVRVADIHEAMGIDWMTRDEMTQAIPPAYTFWIGQQLMDVVAQQHNASFSRGGMSDNSVSRAISQCSHHHTGALVGSVS